MHKNNSYSVISGIFFFSSDQALRIKMDATASGSTVSGITYSGNTGTGLRQFGILIDQSYPDTLKTPGTGVILSVLYNYLSNFIFSDCGYLGC